MTTAFSHGLDAEPALTVIDGTREWTAEEVARLHMDPVYPLTSVRDALISMGRKWRALILRGRTLRVELVPLKGAP